MEPLTPEEVQLKEWIDGFALLVLLERGETTSSILYIANRINFPTGEVFTAVNKRAERSWLWSKIERVNNHITKYPDKVRKYRVSPNKIDLVRAYVRTLCEHEKFVEYAQRNHLVIGEFVPNNAG